MSLSMYFWCQSCINRIRLEFKAHKYWYISNLFSRINRIRLEFKVDTGERVEIWEVVLIESDWNLKGIISGSFCIIGIVLIESDWNLKESGDPDGH